MVASAPQAGAADSCVQPTGFCHSPAVTTWQMPCKDPFLDMQNIRPPATSPDLGIAPRHRLTAPAATMPSSGSSKGKFLAWQIEAQAPCFLPGLQ